MAVTKVDLATQSSGTLPTASIPALTGDVTGTTGATATTVVKINGVSLASLGTGLLKNTTTTGVPSIAIAGTDYVVPSGSITGNAASVGGITVTGTPSPNNVLTATSSSAATWAAPSASPNFADNEVPSGTPNGVLTTFGLAHTPVNSSLSLYLGGILQHAGAGNDYTISGATITMLNVPQTNNTLLANYRW